MPRAVTLALVTALAAPAAAAWATTVEDRYGPPAPAASEAPATAVPASGWLSWSNKSPPPAPRPMRASYAPQPRPFAAAWARAPSAPAAPTTAPAALPTSLYSSAPPAPWTSMGRAASANVSQTAAQASQPPHFYSVHRPFGIAPDPIPLPQQFFADGSPDLAAGPPPLPPRPVPGTQAATSPANTASNRARQVEIETADSAAN